MFVSDISCRLGPDLVSISIHATFNRPHNWSQISSGPVVKYPPNCLAMDACSQNDVHQSAPSLCSILVGMGSFDEDASGASTGPGVSNG